MEVLIVGGWVVPGLLQVMANLRTVRCCPRRQREEEAFETKEGEETSLQE